MKNKLLGQLNMKLWKGPKMKKKKLLGQLNMKLQIQKGPKSEPDVNRTRNLLIWSQTRYHCATDPFLYLTVLLFLIYFV